jgi:hypothetical protein
VQQTEVSRLCPNGNRKGNWQHREADDDEPGNRKDTVTQEATKQAEMLASQRKAPLEEKEEHDQSRDQRSSNPIE